MTYNGHKNWAHWNVSLWISNDEGLYNLAREMIQHTPTRDDAARSIVETLHDCGQFETPDGAKYSYTAVRAAIAGDFA